MSAANRLFHIPELIERILLEITDFRDIFILQGLNHATKDVLDGSKSLHRKMGLLEPCKPVPVDFDQPYPAVINPLLVEHLPVLRAFKFYMYPKIEKFSGGPFVPTGREMALLMAVGNKDIATDDVRGTSYDMRESSWLPSSSWRRARLLGVSCDLHLSVWSYGWSDIKCREYSVLMGSDITLGQLADKIAALVLDPDAGKPSRGGELCLEDLGYKILRKGGSPPPKEEEQFCTVM